MHSLQRRASPQSSRIVQLRQTMWQNATVLQKGSKILRKRTKTHDLQLLARYSMAAPDIFSSPDTRKCGRASRLAMSESQSKLMAEPFQVYCMTALANADAPRGIS